MDLITQIEARVLGVLIEKENVSPAAYPMSLKALTDGCNQKDNRIPRMMLTQSEVLGAVTSLCVAGYARESKEQYKPSRTGLITRYEHNLEKALAVPNQSISILAALLLRGPLTPSQIKLCTDRMHKFSVSEIEGWLRHMSRDREEPVVSPLPRAEGAREIRWVQILTGPVESSRKPLSVDEMMDMVFDLQRRIRILEEDALVRSTD